MQYVPFRMYVRQRAYVECEESEQTHDTSRCQQYRHNMVMVVHTESGGEEEEVEAVGGGALLTGS